MTITIHNTTTTTTVNGVPARVWEGYTDSGIPVVCLITRVAVPNGYPTEQFERELLEQSPPRPELSDAFPPRIVL